MRVAALGLDVGSKRIGGVEGKSIFKSSFLATTSGLAENEEF